MKVLNLFIVDSVLQYFLANMMVETLPECQGNDNILFNVSDRVDCSKASLCWHKVYTYPLPHIKLLSLSSINVMRQVKAALQEVEQNIESYAETHIFMATLFKFQNVVYNTYVINNPHVKYFNYPDGNDSILLRGMGKKKKVTILVKSVLANLCGIKYRYQPTFAKDRIGITLADKVYTFFPDLMDFYTGEIQTLQLPSVTYLQKETLCVFLGMPVTDLAIKDWCTLAQTAAQFIANHNKKLLLVYKPHPREDLTMMYPIFKRYGFQLWSELGYNQDSIEKIVCEGLQPRRVYSWCSSALINLKLMLHEHIECYAYKGLELIDAGPKAKQKLAIIYERVGIKQIQ